MNVHLAYALIPLNAWHESSRFPAKSRVWNGLANLFISLFIGFSKLTGITSFPFE